MTAQGMVEPRFAAVQEEFERNFAERGEVGASVCVTVDGETVVDLWGGIADPETQAPWNKDTIVFVWSCTKGATALCAHILAARAAASSWTRRWRGTGPSSPRAARTASPSVWSSTTRPACRRSANRSPRTGYATGTRSSRPWPPWNRCGSRARDTATMHSCSGTSSARSCGASPATRSAPSSAPRSPSRWGSTSGSACPRSRSRASRRASPRTCRRRTSRCHRSTPPP